MKIKFSPAGWEIVRRLMRKLVLPLMAVLIGSVSGCQAQDKRAVTFVGYNYTERPIFIYRVNGTGGSNLFVNSGGAKWSCCGEVTVGQPAQIVWMYSATEKQYLAGVRKEEHTATVIVPPAETPDASYLEVHFYPDHHVELALVKLPGRRRLPKFPEED